MREVLEKKATAAHRRAPPTAQPPVRSDAWNGCDRGQRGASRVQADHLLPPCGAYTHRLLRGRLLAVKVERCVRAGGR